MYSRSLFIQGLFYPLSLKELSFFSLLPLYITHFMQNFKIINLLTIIMLIITMVFKVKGFKQSFDMPQWLEHLEDKMVINFKRPEDAHFLFSVFTGNKRGLFPKLLADFKLLSLGFLLAPTGLHLSGILYFYRKTKKKFPFYLSAWCLPGFFSLKRMALFRLLNMSPKLKGLSPFYITFIISFFCGHFVKSPQGYIYSFLFIGTFLCLGEWSLFRGFMALAAAHLLINCFQGDAFSFVGLFFSLILVQIFSFLFPIFIIFIVSFYIFPSHWIEPLIQFFIFSIHTAAQFSHGTFLTSSFMLLTAIWFFLLEKKKRWILLFLLLHSELAETPLILSGHDAHSISFYQV